MFKYIRIDMLVAIAAVIAIVNADPNAECLAAQGRRNHKDLYTDAADCHKYFQCFYINSTHAIGYSRECPQGQFWHDPVLSCMPEGDIPCVDRCLSEDATSARGCYAGAGCRQYFSCSNTGSNGMCCPEGTSFDEATCSCQESETCNDACVQQAPAVATTVAPAAQVNATACVDSFGSAISIVAGEGNAYILLTEEGWATEKRYCPTGVSFDIVSCRCNIENGATIPNTITKRQATLKITFDNNEAADDSFNNFATFLLDGAQVSNGRLQPNGGYLSIPGLKSFDSRDAGSWCAFFQGTGAILSNNKDSTDTEYTVVAGATQTTFSARLNFWHPVGGVTLQSTFTPAANNHFCVTYGDSQARLYLNGQIADNLSVGGYLSISHAPFVVGHDQSVGGFNGNIDSVLITPFAMTQEEVNFHRTGNYAALANLGFF